MKQFCNIFLSVFFCLFTISSYAQEFIPSLGLTTGDWGYNEIGNMNREKLMPYHTSAIKKNGISKEFHVIDQDTVAIFTYSSKGLLITSVLKPGEIFAKEVFEFSYNEDDELIEISCISHTSKKLSGYSRDSLGQINSIWSQSPPSDKINFNFIYDKGKLIEVGDYKKTGNKFVHKINKVDAVIAYDLYGREVLSNRDGGLKNENLFDKQGRWSQNRYSYIFEREQLYSITDITFKNDLMQKITEKYPNIYAFGDTQIRSSIETVVKYETGFVTKK